MIMVVSVVVVVSAALLSVTDEELETPCCHATPPPPPPPPTPPTPPPPPLTPYPLSLSHSQLGEKYYLAKSIRRMQMRLRVYVRRELRDGVKDIEMAGENTGLAGVVANIGW